MEGNNLSKLIVSSIFNATPLTLQTWRAKLSIDGCNPVPSTISDWKNRKTVMRCGNREVFIKCLLNDEDLRKYETTIREKVIADLKIPPYRGSYVALIKKDYKDFLNYVLLEITPEFIEEKTYQWDNVSTPDILSLIHKKIHLLRSDLRFTSEFNKTTDNSLILIYKKNIMHTVYECRVHVHVFLKSLSADDLINFCQQCYKANSQRLTTLLFVTSDVPDSVYLKALQEYRTFLIKIDAFDIDAIDSFKSYIPVISSDAKESMMSFLNRIAEVTLQKILRMHHIILKEIISRNYDFEKVNVQYFRSNAGVWDYKYPIRRALAFEENLMDRMLKVSAKKGYGKTMELLDINLTGGLYGLRLSSRVKRVTCVDFTTSSLETTSKIIEKYNQEKGTLNEGIQNIRAGYLRLDTLNILGIEVPTGGYDIIMLGLGGGSYIEDLPRFIRKISTWLKSDGILFLSVYNKNALCRYSDQLDNMDFTYDGHYFRHQGSHWHLPVRLYSYQEIYNIVLNHFDIEESYSYPTILSTVSSSQNTLVLDKLKEVDKIYARNGNWTSDNGMFNMICAKNYDKAKITDCYKETREYLSQHKLPIESIHHEYISSVDSMYRALYNQRVIIVGNFMKVVLLHDKNNTNEQNAEQNELYFFIILPLEQKVDKSNLESWYEAIQKRKMVKSKLTFCTEIELKELGLASGSISPFSYPIIKNAAPFDKKITMHLFYDSSLLNADYKDIYTYSGSLNTTYCIPTNEFLDYLKSENGIVFG